MSQLSNLAVLLASSVLLLLLLFGLADARYIHRGASHIHTRGDNYEKFENCVWELRGRVRGGGTDFPFEECCQLAMFKEKRACHRPNRSYGLRRRLVEYECYD